MFSFITEKTFHTGTRVVFRKEMVEQFIRETTGHNPDLQKYQQMVLGGVEQTGLVSGMISNLVNVAYPDGWKVPIHPKYLQPLSSTE